MIILKHPADIHSLLLSKKEKALITGFVPTMGALHEGHLSIIRQSLNDNDLTICSIFINPTQFNDPRDFEKYPSTIENDIYLLEKAGCHVLFLPGVNDIYPNGLKSDRQYELGYLENILEGKYRPGHFQGVCQVVHRLLDIIAPDKLYLGQKDFQQCMVIKKLISLIGIKTQLVICPTRREPSGLALSSRNLRLNEEERKRATGIYESLLAIKNQIKKGGIENVTETAIKALTDKGFKVDYIALADEETLEIITSPDGTTPLVALAAAYINEVRLIDNIILK